MSRLPPLPPTLPPIWQVAAPLLIRTPIRLRPKVEGAQDPGLWKAAGLRGKPVKPIPDRPVKLAPSKRAGLLEDFGEDFDGNHGAGNQVFCLFPGCFHFAPERGDLGFVGVVHPPR